jgi:hypothetical protein
MCLCFEHVIVHVQILFFNRWPAECLRIMHFQVSKSKRVVPTQAAESGKESGSEELEGGEYALSDDGSGLGLGSGSLLTRNAKSFLSRMSKAFVGSGGGAQAAGADGDCVTEVRAWDAAQTVRLFCWRELLPQHLHKKTVA